MSKEFTGLSDIELYSLLRGKPKVREAAFAELYSRHNKRVFMYCRRILGNGTLAEDVFQDTFLNFLKSADNEKVMTNVPAYLLRIARNLCLKHKRDNKFNLVPLDDLQVGFSENKLENEEMTNILISAMDLLSDEFREALVLQIYNDMSYAEIAEFLEVPVTTVRNWVVRAKKKLREILSPYMEISN